MVSGLRVSNELITDEGSIPREIWEDADKMRREVCKLLEIVDEFRAVTARHDSFQE